MIQSNEAKQASQMVSGFGKVLESVEVTEAREIVRKGEVQDDKFNFAFLTYSDKDYKEYLKAVRLLKKVGEIK